MDPALNLTVERARPIPFSLTTGKTREETVNRRTDNGRRASDLRKDDLPDGPLSEQATVDRIAAADKPVCCFKGRRAEPKQSRTSSEHPQLERAVPLSWPDETPSDSFDFAPIGETQVLRSRRRELDEGITKHDALLGLHRAVTRLTLPRFPAVHAEDGSQFQG